MDYARFREVMCSVPGVIRVDPLPTDVLDGILSTESSMVVADGLMRMHGVGLHRCLSTGLVLVMFCDGGFGCPEEVTLRMVSTDGTVIGHEVIPGTHHLYADDPDVIWFSPDFIMYASRIGMCDARLELDARELSVDGLENDVLVFYPSLPTAEFLNIRYGMHGSVSTVIIGVDGVDPPAEQVERPPVSSTVTDGAVADDATGVR